ncbi:hypothetical protein [Salinisphaera hydrothermalis]|uniref:Lipoprotein n=1 Tax=Salinisphaera hydrothermalis (strain C41B8) TaxID=1304275 RepID=A0A084IN37_SALHC|nr:hypothetical protein [Salinisphaera hydrothermalis]KEZ78121.1 hypothetical protein C41B8_06037 [Salinisphaera hydrothermalis C41B8]
MNKKISTLLIAAILGLTTLTLAACDNDDGPAEKAGQKIDNAADNTSDAMEDAGDKASDAADDAADKAKDATDND